jgi:DNA-binding transcriptional regulator YhcF (GntR family)
MPMNLSISKESDIPIHQQIVRQLIFLIATRQLPPGETLPSVRGLAMRLKIHHNTVSQAYQELVESGLLVGRRGTRMVVRAPDAPIDSSPTTDLDDLINETIRTARENGYTLQQLRERLLGRLLAEPPDHVLALSVEAGMRSLFRMELEGALDCPIDLCSPADLAANPGLGIGAVALCPPGSMPKVVSLLPKDRPVVPIVYSDATEQLQIIRALKEPSLIAVVSISQYFLDTARGVLGPLIGGLHSMREYLVTDLGHKTVGAADVIVADSATYAGLRAQVKHTTVVCYPLISQECVESISATIEKPTGPESSSIG